jgi:hypothetical protein
MVKGKLLKVIDNTIPVAISPLTLDEMDCQFLVNLWCNGGALVNRLLTGNFFVTNCIMVHPQLTDCKLDSSRL